MKNLAKVVIAPAICALLLTSCGGTDKVDKPAAAASTAKPVADKAAKPADKAANAEKKTTDPNVTTINENPIGEAEAPYLDISTVYFQPIDMEQGSVMVPPRSSSDMHFEVDVKTNDKASEIGYESDQFMPYLEISAKLTDESTGKVGYSGTLMPMIASDGPHYGNNIKLAKGSYKVELTIKYPGDKFMLHTGKDSSAVKGRFPKSPEKVTLDKKFDWDGRQL